MQCYAAQEKEKKDKKGMKEGRRERRKEEGGWKLMLIFLKFVTRLYCLMLYKSSYDYHSYLDIIIIVEWILLEIQQLFRHFLVQKIFLEIQNNLLMGAFVAVVFCFRLPVYSN